MMMGEGKSVRYRGCIPKIEKEGYFKMPLKVTQDCKISGSWYKNLNPWDRLSSHQTLSSARRFAGFVCTEAPKDDLDFVLGSTFNPVVDIFPDKVDVYLQPETRGIRTWRRLRNIIKLSPKRPVPLGHPLYVGGIKEKKDPNNVKLMNISHHAPQTNAGYIRNGQGGNIFYY